MSVKKGSLVIAFLVLLSAFSLTLTIIPENVRASTLFVGGTGPGNYTGIQDAIIAADPGDTVYVYNGTYYENVEVHKPLSLVGEHEDTTTIDGRGSGDVVHVTSDWVNITRFTVTNSGSTGPVSGIELFGAQNCSITDNNVVHNNFGISLHSSNNSTIANNRAWNSTRGIHLLYSNFNMVINNKAVQIEGEAIRLYISENNTIVKNIVQSNNMYGISLHHSHNNSIVDNNVSDSGTGIYVYLSDYLTVTNNSALSNTWFSIRIEASIGATIVNNILERGIFMGGQFLDHWNTHKMDTSNIVAGKPLHYWKNVTGGSVPPGAGQVILANCTDVTIGNQHLIPGSAGIEVAFSSSVTITNNSVSSAFIGIIHIDSHNSTISDNVISDNYNGISVRGDNNTIANNTISNSDWGGLRLGFSDYNKILSNTILDNGEGIAMMWADSNTIVGNTIIANGNGFSIGDIWAGGGNDNQIYHNNIVDNTLQAYDVGFSNHWDNGYPSGGNYWSDFSGVDIYSGPNQNIPGSDGIGDTRYGIASASWDEYPLMSAYGVVRPRPPIISRAIMSGRNLENVTLNWDLSPDDGGGLKIVTGYEIFRNSSHDLNGLGYQLVAFLLSATSEFVDNYAGEGDPNNYFYQVCAVDVNNNSSCSKNQTAKFTRPLSKGPNLVSIPLIQSDETIHTVLQTLSYDNAWSYDPVNQEWRSFMNSKPYDQSLEYMNHTMGIWVDVTQDSNLTVAGVVPTSTAINLQAGWNLVGFPSFDDNFTVADLKAAIAVERIEGFDALAPPYFLRAMADGDFLQAGFGYWVQVKNETVWTVDNT